MPADHPSNLSATSRAYLIELRKESTEVMEGKSSDIELIGRLSARMGFLLADAFEDGIVTLSLCDKLHADFESKIQVELETLRHQKPTRWDMALPVTAFILTFGGIVLSIVHNIPN